MALLGVPVDQIINVLLMDVVRVEIMKRLIQIEKKSFDSFKLRFE